MTPEEFRAHFPSLDRQYHFASCSQGALATSAANALAEFQRSVLIYGAPWDRWMEEVERARELFAEFVNAPTSSIAIVPSATEAAFQSVSALELSSRNQIVTSDLEFPSVANAWLAQRQRGAEVLHAKSNEGQIAASDFIDLLSDKTQLVSIPLVTYRNGHRLPVREVAAAAREVGAHVFIDAYQGAGVVPIDVGSLKCDFLTTGSLKYLLGIAGIAFLYVNPEFEPDCDPLMTGWFGQKDPFAFDPYRNDHPVEARRYETGTPAVASAYAAVAGLELLTSLDMAEVEEHITGLTRLATERISELGLPLDSPRDDEARGPQVAIHAADPEGLAAYLADSNIVVSPRGSLVRVSFHYYNSTDDVDYLLERLHAWAGRNSEAQ